MVAARENATSEKNISDLQTILNDLMLNTKISESNRLAHEVQKAPGRGHKDVDAPGEGLHLGELPHAAEHYAADLIRKRDGLNWSEWAGRVNEYLNLLEALFSPDLFILGGGVGLYVSLGSRNPSPAIALASLLVPFATFYAITSFLLQYTLSVFLVTLLAYGFTTAALLVPALYEFDVAMGRTTED